jgi:NADH:ubiquinone oxidoreductase subunit 5 (subunit L)/multisubunit Na+/H+ antiporter MnhA subunit
LYLRFLPEFVSFLFFLVIFVAAVTILFRRISALYEIDLKKVVAFSTLRQLGFILLRVSVGIYYFSFLHLILHAFFKSVIFLCTGILIHTVNTQDSRKYGSIYNKLNYIIIILYISILALRGVPFLSGFFSKDKIVDYFLRNKRLGLIFILIVISVGLRRMYGFRLFIYSTLKITAKQASFIKYFYSTPLIILGTLRIRFGALICWVAPVESLISYPYYFLKLFIIFYITVGFIVSIILSNGIRFIQNFFSRI